MYRKILSFALVFFLVSVLASVLVVKADTGNVKSNKAKTSFKTEKYGIFLGVEKKDIKKIKNYDLIVIDADNFTKEEIRNLKKQRNKKIFSYINIGSVENFREYYDDFKDITLGDYENWEEEKWVNVSDKKWQKHISSLSLSLKAKGIDGFFADNADVYYHYNNSKIYSALLKILGDMKKTSLPVIINGGDTFVSKAISENKAKNLIYGVNQETVLSRIDFDSKSFSTSSKDVRDYFVKYLKACKDNGIKVYVTEYTKDKGLKNEIRKFCEKNGYNFYISSTIELSKVE